MGRGGQGTRYVGLRSEIPSISGRLELGQGMAPTSLLGHKGSHLSLGGEPQRPLCLAHVSQFTPLTALRSRRALFSPAEGPGHWGTAGPDLDREATAFLVVCGLRAGMCCRGGRWPQRLGLGLCPLPWFSEPLGTWPSWTWHAWHPGPAPAHSCRTGPLLQVGSAAPHPCPPPAFFSPVSG